MLSGILTTVYRLCRYSRLTNNTTKDKQLSKIQTETKYVLDSVVFNIYMIHNYALHLGY